MMGNNIDTPLDLMCDTDEIIQKIALSSKCYFYDTSSFRNHASTPCRKLILQYLTQMQGVVIITRSVFLELCSADGTLWKTYIAYINEMKEMGIKVLLIYEENIVELLQNCYSNVSQINAWLSYAVKCVKSKYGAIENSLAQELLCVCLHMLTNIPETVPYKYVMLTDDKNAVRLLGQVKQNVAKYAAQKYLAAHTSANLCWHMKNNGIITCTEEILQILNGEKGNEKITTYCSDRYDLFPEMQSMTCEVLAEKIMQGEITIYM